MGYPAGTLIIHGPTSRFIARRLAMDLRSEGIDAHPIAQENLTGDDWLARFRATPGFVIVHDWWISQEILEALGEIHRETDPKRPVVVVRSGTRRFPPELEQFHVVSLFEGQRFPHYQPYRKNHGGWAYVTGFLGGGTRPKDKRRRGFAFLSYSSRDRTFINEKLVPALEACDIGFFDYQFTEHLDEKKLEHELERAIRRCALVIAYTSAHWRNSNTTTREGSLAQQIGRPIVSIAPVEVALGFPTIPCQFRGDSKTNEVELKKAIQLALSASAFSAAAV
jgi:hypothetical protein